MISMKLFSQTPPSIDGMRIEATKDNGLSWETIGELSKNKPSGINWPNTENIISLPPDSNNLSQGWSGLTDGWQTLSHSLSSLSNENSLGMRIRFNSLQPNPIHEGFAIDSVWIGERNKKVLVGFSTNAPTGAALDTWTADLDFILQQVTELSDDVLYYQFHTNFPENDPISFLNEDPPSSLALQYSLSDPNLLIIDGTIFSENIQELTSSDLILRSLEPAPFLIEDVVFNMSGGDLDDISFQIRAEVSFPERELIVKTALLDPFLETPSNWPFGERQLNNILVDMLPDGGGLYLQRSWEAGDNITLNVNKEKAFPNFNFNEVNLLIWIEDLHTKEVYQSHFQDSPITILERPERQGNLPEIISSLSLYPNPAKEVLFFDFKKDLESSMEVVLQNIHGQIVMQAQFEPGNHQFSIDLQALPASIYLVKVVHQGQILGRKKILIER